MKYLTYELVKMLYLRFSAIFGAKFTKNHNEIFIKLWYDEWFEGLKNIQTDTIRVVLDQCRQNMEWPPSIAEFLKLCEKHEGMPQLENIQQLCFKKDFSHQVTRDVYEKIGSWSFSHDTEKVLAEKIKGAYDDAVQKFRKINDLNSIESKTYLKLVENA